MSGFFLRINALILACILVHTQAEVSFVSIELACQSRGMITSADFQTQALTLRAVQTIGVWLASAHGRLQRGRMPNFHPTRRMRRGISWFVAFGIVVSFVASLQYRGVFKSAAEWVRDAAEYLAVSASTQPEPTFRQRILGLSPGNLAERQLIHLEEGLKLLDKEIDSRQTKPVPVAVIDASPPGPFAPGVLPLNTHMKLNRHGIEVADVVNQMAADRVDIWTISAGVDSGYALDFSDLGRAIRFATANGVKVIVLSLSPLVNVSGMDAIKEALDAGVVVVEGTGNGDGQTLASFDARTIRVSGVTSNGERARHANVGMMSDGFQIATIFAPYYLYFQSREGPYPVLAGTSFATPPWSVPRQRL